MVLETNSKLSIITNDDGNTIGFSLQDVIGIPEELQKELQHNKDTGNW